MMILASYLRSEDDNFEVLAIHDDQTLDTLEFQRALAFDDQDRRLGEDIYCIVREGAAYYGGIEWWSFRDDEFTLRFDDEAGEALELPNHTTITVDQNSELIPRYLPEILKEVPRRE